MNLGGTIHITKTGCCVLIGSVIVLLIYFLPTTDIKFKSTRKISLNHLLSLAVQTAEFGGKQVAQWVHSGQVSSKGKTKEGANDSVTTADFVSHCVMLNTINGVFPTLRVISEENVNCKGIVNKAVVNLQLIAYPDDVYVDEDDIKIWIDPLDATQEYTEMLTEYVTTMVCVAIKGKPVIGVIYKPFLTTTYWGWVGKRYSTTLTPNLNAIYLNELKFIVSRSHSGEVSAKIHSLFKHRVARITYAGGAGYKVIEVVNDKADAYVHVTAIKKWDICAGNAIINTVGGKMTTLHGDVIDYADESNVVNEDGIFATVHRHLDITLT